MERYPTFLVGGRDIGFSEEKSNIFLAPTLGGAVGRRKPAEVGGGDFGFLPNRRKDKYLVSTPGGEM